jgi:hypothetical protein
MGDRVGGGLDRDVGDGGWRERLWIGRVVRESDEGGWRGR